MKNKSPQSKRPKYTNCLYCAKELKMNRGGFRRSFCGPMCRILYLRDYEVIEKVSSLFIPAELEKVVNEIN